MMIMGEWERAMTGGRRRADEEVEKMRRSADEGVGCSDAEGTRE